MFLLKKEMTLFIPEAMNECGKYAAKEFVRLLKKLGCKAVCITSGKTFRFVLAEKNAEIAKKAPSVSKVKNNGFVLKTEDSYLDLTAKTEKGLLNGIYTIIEQLGITYLMPSDKNEWIAPGAPFALSCGTEVKNMLSNRGGVACEFAVVTEEEYTGEEWMEYFAKLRFDFVARHAGGHIKNDKKFGFFYSDGAHEFHHLLPKDFMEANPETCRQIQPDDFLGKRVNDVNFCYTSEKAWKEIEKNFRKYASEYKDLDHLILEFADLPGGGHCMCANCRHYSAADLQAIVMNRFAEIVEKLGLHATIQMNAYHDTMMPSKLFPPRKNIRIAFAPRERCWAHALNDPACERNKFYVDCLKAWNKYAFPYAEAASTTGYYTDQILFRGLYPFTPDVIAKDWNFMVANGVDELVTLQVGGQILQPDFNLIFHSALLWNPDLNGKTFCREISRRIAGKEFAPILEKYLQKRIKVFIEVLKWCGVDKEICHLDYRWLKEDESDFFKKMVTRLHKASGDMKKAADKLKNSITDCPAALKKLLTDESLRAEFESGVIEGMSLQQKVFCKLPAARRTRDPKLVKECRDELQGLIRFLRKSIKAGDKIGIGMNAYYGRFVDPWMINDISKKIDWCNAVLKG